MKRYRKIGDEEVNVTRLSIVQTSPTPAMIAIRLLM